MNVNVYRKLKLEALEEKKLLAADVGLADGLLFIEGSSQDDSVVVSQSGNTVEVSQGDEVITFDLDQVDAIRFNGNDGDDVFQNQTEIASVAFGNRGDDTLVGGSNVDDLRGGPGNDILLGRDGNDELHGDYGNDRLDGGNGDDDVRGWFGDDVLLGGNGNDYVSGYLGDDVLRGGDGDDVIKGHEGDDQLYGDDGNDLLYGWRGDDWLSGGDGDDYLSAWSGDDILVGGSGDDTLRGHSGRDLLIAGDGSDNVNGGSGEDFVITGLTRFDDDPEVLDRVLSVWDTEETIFDRLDNLRSFISSSVRSNDGDADAIFDTRDELDLFLFDQRDEFFEG